MKAVVSEMIMQRSLWWVTCWCVDGCGEKGDDLSIDSGRRGDDVMMAAVGEVMMW